MNERVYLSRPAEPALTHSPFPQQAYQATLRQPFLEARALLPEPLLPDQPHWVEMYWRAWELIWQHLRKARVGVGFVADYLATGELMLDEAALGVVYGVYGRRAFPFTGTLDNFYARQHEDGFICRQLRPEDGADRYHPFAPNGTGPNILAWAEWRHYRATGDNERLQAVFYPLLAYHRWCRANRTWPNGLYWTTGLAGGQPDAGRVPGGRTHHRHWTWLDANLQASLDCICLSQMAVQLNLAEPAAELEAERQQLLRMINEQLWQKEAGYYFDVDPEGKPGLVKSLTAYWALLDKGLAAPAQLEGLLRHLRSEDCFNSPFPLPNVALSTQTPANAPVVVSPSMTYVVVKGLRHAGQHKLSHELAQRHLTQVCDVFERTDTFWDHYAVHSTAADVEAAASSVTTAGLVAIGMLLEDVIGLHVDWPLRRVLWDKRLAGTGVGVRNYPLGTTGRMSLVAQNGTAVVETDSPFTLTVQDEMGSVQLAVPAGTTEIDL